LALCVDDIHPQSVIILFNNLFKLISYILSTDETRFMDAKYGVGEYKTSHRDPILINYSEMKRKAKRTVAMESGDIEMQYF
jgi:hypothetical protein